MPIGTVSLMALLPAVGDPRWSQDQYHSLGAILLIAILAVICGADCGTEVEFFGRQKQAWLKTCLELPHDGALHDTFGRVFGLLDPAQLEACSAAWVQPLASILGRQIRPMDGKEVRGSHDET